MSAAPAVTEEVPDVIGTVRGYRSWDLHSDGTLEAKVHHYRWQPGVNTAKCGGLTYHWESYLKHGKWQDRQRQVPDMTCTCGFYACTNPSSSQIHPGLYGVVEMSGGIVEHKKGTVVRAGKAKIVAVHMPRMRYTDHQVMSVQAKYPDVQIFRSRIMLLRKFPPAKPHWPGWRKFLFTLAGGVQVATAGMYVSNYIAGRTSWLPLPFAAMFLYFGLSNLFLFYGQVESTLILVSWYRRVRQQLKGRRLLQRLAKRR